MLRGADERHNPNCHADKLPNEVLGLIFDEFTSARAEENDEPASAALVLSHVCHRWKEFLTSSHWASVRIRHLNHPKILDDILSRSGNHHLDIAVRLGHIDADYFWPRGVETVKIQWRLYDLFHTLADHQARLRRLTVEAKQAVFAWFEQVIIARPLFLTHLTLIQSDKETCMHNFASLCFDLSACVSLTLVHTSIILRENLEWPSLHRFRMSDIRAYELIGWTYEVDVDEIGHYHYARKPPTYCFASVRSLSISNTLFVKKRQQIIDLFSLFPNVQELELDCVDSGLILDTLENDGSLMPCLQRVLVDGTEVYYEVAVGVVCIDDLKSLSLYESVQ